MQILTETPKIFSDARHCKGVKIYRGGTVDGLYRSLTRYLIGINEILMA